MKKIILPLLTAVLSATPAAWCESRDAFISGLMAKMTLSEKIGQISCPLGWPMYEKTGRDKVGLSKTFTERMDTMPVGNFWCVLRADPWTQKTLETGLSPRLSAEALNAMQHYAVENTRLGIPILFAEECAHGHMAIGTTVFPTALGQASTWNVDLMRRMGGVIAREARLQGAAVGYGPVVDIAREPRWSRMEETFGEDPFLTGRMAGAMVSGMQGDKESGSWRDGSHVLATLKHFAAYGVPQGGLNGEQANIGQRQLLSEFVPHFKYLVEQGAGTVMTSYNAIDGIPCTGNKYLLTDVLRGQWGFKGAVYSDLQSIEGIAQTHHCAENFKEAGAMALKAGVDIDLEGRSYAFIGQALSEGLVTMDDIDRAVRHVLELKYDLGLFENPYVDPDMAEREVRSTQNKEMAREVARQSVVLLENNGILPLSKELGKIAVIGPNADNMYNQLGDYTAPQDRKEISTVLDGVRMAAPSASVSYVKGCAIRDTTQTDIAAAVKACLDADVTILVVGGSSARDFKTKYYSTGAADVSDAPQTLSDLECGEGSDRADLRLLGDQERLMKALLDTGRPIVIVYIEGRPLNMNMAAGRAAALCTAWYPGEQGGAGIADVLFGDYNPAGRLPVSIPRSVGQLPVHYSKHFSHNYIDSPEAPLYAFGYGLSYTRFSYSGLRLRQPAEPGVLQEVTVTVKNEGDRDGAEVVQLYVNDKTSSVETPPMLLKAFNRVELKKGESRDITFRLTADELSLCNSDMMEVVEPGEFEVMVGAASNDIRLRGTFEIK